MVREASNADALTDEYEALTGGCALVPNLGRERLVVTGEDRIRFVNGLVTCEVKTLAPGRGALGFLTSQKGRVIADLVVWAEQERLELDVPPGRADLVAGHLLDYKVADRVEVSTADERAEILVAGPRAAECLETILDGEPPGESWSRGTVAGFEVTSEAWIGVPLWRIRLGSDGVDGLRSKLQGKGALQVGAGAVDAVRVERGRPLFGIDFGDDSLPQETGLVGEAVSFTKGCYLGQEIIARIHYRGRASRELRGLRVVGEGSLSVGDEVLLGGSSVGHVSTAAFSPVLGSSVALATLHRSAGPGSAPRLPDGTGLVVVELPFVDTGS